MEDVMTQIAKIFNNGRSQAVRLPAAYRFEGTEVFIRKDPDTGDVILSRRPTSWKGLFDAIKAGGVPADFLGPGEREQEQAERDPFAEVAQ
jgi:antitoxin VapB